MEWLSAHYKDILAIFGAAVALASAIVKLTPTQKDDNVLSRIIKVLVLLSLYNEDGTMDNKTEDKKSK